MATTQQIRNAIRAAGIHCNVNFKGETTYTDTKPSGTYVCFPMPWGTKGHAGAVAEQANFILFTMTGEKDVVRVLTRPYDDYSYRSGRAYLRATAK